MSAKWTWVFGVATFASFVLALIFFAATQSITARDGFAMAIGVVFGATLASFVATFVFHGDGRTRRIAREAAARSRKLRLIEALPTRSEEINRLIIRETDLSSHAARAHGRMNAMKRKSEVSRSNGFADDAAAELGESDAALHLAVGLRQQRDLARAELARLRAMTDEEFLAEQRRLRGLD